MATGQLPSAPRPLVHSGSKELLKPITGNLLTCSNKGFHTNNQACSEPAVPICSSDRTRVSKFEDHKDQSAPWSTQFSNSDAAHGVQVQLRGRNHNSHMVDSKQKASEIDVSCYKYECRENPGVSIENGAIRQDDKDNGILSHSGDPTFGSLYYKPPQLENCDVILASAGLDTSSLMQQVYEPNSVVSPTNCFTPDVNNFLAHHQNIESLLRTIQSVARNCPNTPSILRRTKKEVQTPGTASSNVQTDEEKVPDDLSTPVEKERMDRSRRRSRLLSVKSPCNGNDGVGLYHDVSPPSILRRTKREMQTPGTANGIVQTDEEMVPDDLSTPVEKERMARSQRRSRLLSVKSPCNGNGGVGLYHDVSPPYRLRSKRTALFRSVEKQLEFTVEDDNVNRKHMSFSLKGKPDSMDSNVEPASMNVGKLNHRENGLNNIAKDYVDTTDMGVT
ncbi:hypothetical protein QJS10_CPA03g01630 [Acorus calamus]|uniref:Uncharacterized protein n=1 Tax=Acorus calamus TaxID=4465 RepID=A0AAV9FD67_ACOCL|nr:hypothetical protein QJS10_CPA03g01630 [Acorus calamus]